MFIALFKTFLPLPDVQMPPVLFKTIFQYLEVLEALENKQKNWKLHK